MGDYLANAANLWACQVVGGGPILPISAGAFNTMCAQQDDPNSLPWAIDPNDAYRVNCYVPYGTVAGQVTDGTTGNGIPSVCVQVITPTGKVVTSVAANATGDYHVVLKAGSYKLIGFDHGCAPGAHAGTYWGGAPISTSLRLTCQH